MKPRRRLFAAQVREAPSVALLVHGTFAGAPEDRGEKWWQSGSPVAQRLQQDVPPSVEVAPSRAVFHWSGENSERARSKAAYALLSRLIEFERSHQPYHLVGHSHGGSVIWNTLKLATIKRIELSQLRSWTTVGTPFLQHRSRNAWNPVNLAAIVIGLLLLRPAYRTLWQISILLWNAATGSKEGLVLPWDRDSQTIHFFESPVLAFLQWIGIPMEFSSVGVRVGSFDPQGSQSLAAYLFATREGLFFFSMAVFAAYLFLIIGLMCIRPAIESYRIRAEQRLEDDAFAAYQSRWLGIWSTDDEAINGLRATLDLTM